MTTPAELNDQGIALFNKGDVVGARLHYQAALKLDPNFLPPLANLAVAYSADNNLQAAEACLSRVVAVAPNDGRQWNNLGNILMRGFKYEDAEFAFARAAALIPDNPDTWHNYSLLASRLGQYDRAAEFIERAKALGLNTVAIDNDLSLTLLHKGDDFKTALEIYEKRWEVIPHSQAWDYYIPEWQGEDLQGKRVLFHAEQGYGDTLMTLRFVHDLEALGAHVTVGVLPGMVRLCEAQGWNALDLYKMTAEDTARFDFQSPMFSTMRWLGVERDSIRGESYLKAPRILTGAIARSSFNVGICWASGMRGGDVDWRRRLSPLEELAAAVRCSWRRAS